MAFQTALTIKETIVRGKVFHSVNLPHGVVPPHDSEKELVD